MNNGKFFEDIESRTLADALPAPLFVVDEDVRILDANQAAHQMLNSPPEIVLRKLCGEVLHCNDERQSEQGCGETVSCPECVIRKAVRKAYEGEQAFRMKYTMHLNNNHGTQTVHLLITASAFERQGDKLALLTLEDITDLTSLQELLPICASCKKVRNDDQYWESVETFMHKHAGASFTHGLCPDCTKKLYPDIFK